MRFRFLWIGETKDHRLAAMEADYLDRLRQFFPTERSWVRESRKTDRHQRVTQEEKEARRLEKKIDPRTYLIVLDEKGRNFNSLGLAGFLESLMIQGTADVTFLVGGHQGIPDRIKGLAAFKLALSKLTFSHELARIMLMEQIYRAVSIIKRLPYHK